MAETALNMTPERPADSSVRVYDFTASKAPRQAYRLLRFAFAAAPILAGLDKFANVMTDWTDYLAPQITQVTTIPAATFMMIVGVIEVIAGIGVAVRPRVFGYVVAAWLAGIIVNLLLLGQYFDVALRDLGLALGALALARLSEVYENR